jgi:PAS domain S-box-containing protein
LKRSSASNLAAATRLHPIPSSSELEHALRQSETQFRLLVETIPQQVWTSLPDGAVDYVNENWHRFRGLTLEQSAGVGWRGSIHPEDLPGVEERWNHSIRTGDPFEHTYRVRHGDGTFSWVLGRALALKDEHGKVLRWYGTNTDIHGQKLAEEALRQAEKLAATGRLAATIAHEINNPLTAVTNLLYLLRCNPSLNAEAKEQIKLAEQELLRVSQICKQTLGFARDNSGPTRLDLLQLARESVDLFKGKLSSRNICLKIAGEGECYMVGRAGELRQVLSNLLANALDAVEPGGVISIGINGDPALQSVSIEVADNGCGIRQENHSKIFDAFYTTKQDVGTGLGLWITKEIVERNAGVIALRSSTAPADHGTCFTVTFPRMPSAGAGE